MTKAYRSARGVLMTLMATFALVPVAVAAGMRPPRMDKVGRRAGPGFVVPPPRRTNGGRSSCGGRPKRIGAKQWRGKHGTTESLNGSIGEHDKEEDDASKEFAPHSPLTDMYRTQDDAATDTAADQRSTDGESMRQQQQQQQQSCLQRRQFLVASAAVLAAQMSLPTPPSNALDAYRLPSLTEKVNYQQSPINKRYGVSLAEAERIYPLTFITYLARFLLVFDDECTRWWYTQAQAIPTNASKGDVENLRLRQFGQFAASVEVGLIDFEKEDERGILKLIDSLTKRYGPASLPAEAPERDVLRSKEALRQIGLLFSLLGEYQPVDYITQILAADDDAKITKVIMMDGGCGYPPPAYLAPDVEFPEPPTLRTSFGGSTARGKAIMRNSGKILKVELTQGGRGYSASPTVNISYTPSADGGSGDNGGGNGDAATAEGGVQVRATAQAYLGKKKLKGSVERIEIVDPGLGYGEGDITVTVSPPEAPDGVAATAKAILEYEITGVEILDSGSGYAAEKPINIVIDPPPGAASGSGGRARSAFAVAYPKGKSTSYESFIGGGTSKDVVSASLSNVDTTQWVTGPTSSQLLALLPSGFGLQYDDALERYILSRSTSSNNWDDILGGSLEGQKFKPINPIFGFRGRSPIEKEKTLDVSKVARFIASGAICSSIAHLLLTPVDVVKTKVQTKPDVYNSGIVGNFRKVLEEEGASTFFDGWEPTFAGFFVAGGIAFFFTEYFRRYYTSLIMTVMMRSASEVGAATAISSLEIPLIVASAATSAFFCCFLLAPFDAVRIRTVSQPDYADDIFGVVSRMVEEEGLLSLFSTVPVWFVKEIPFNIMKFLVFDTSTEYMYEAFPAAREDIRLSLLISLFGGTLGGIAATIVSNPADVVVSELKKSKTEMSPLEAVERIKERAGIKGFATGMPLRMIYYSLLVSLQFLLYDSVRIALGVGSDDMKLYLNVLNVALNEKVKQ
mmetsp:Transcript_47139/g.100246  ORF Transcript_47139/g.100246 Transcript_47139/m.100246 type:complete len:967 (-) Transcript_47139:1003-3903(-)|eukprot:CAMPEP_0172543186 /NCGR_PEP_ID=MMETSP1067-20121228/13635_1 /TAXON_ID=265564 ORGANISM="Thalassiosira punctigera, Strain Tpunct2005C2" /NCGR_SAMPLE_ID=MMETSP1067 /ASSEMBLY_ACC=CAM_ASM_000444 /LENGTH=966 /DNA_ID=CAMNT_0013329553 /DNA_START=71 /DNA_END=2971 /DNA_ORIENTATION=-